MRSYNICLFLSGLFHLALLYPQCLPMLLQMTDFLIFMAEQYCIIYTNTEFSLSFICQWTLNCFYVLAIVNAVAINRGAESSLR